MNADQPIGSVDIERIWNARGLGDVRTVEVPQRGSVNACFLVNDDLVIRFQVRHPTSTRFRSESIAYEILRRSGLPVPEPIALDESLEIVPVAYLITTRLPGTSIIDSWPHLGNDLHHELAHECGRLQAQMHSVTVKRFGDLEDSDGGGFGSWPEYLFDYFKRYARLGIDQALLDPATVDRIDRVLTLHHSMFMNVPAASLLHSDYHFENILQVDGRVTGIVDFEWALGGDAAFDCRVDDRLEDMCPGSVKPFYEGYQSVRKLGPDHRRKTEIYALLLNLESVAAWNDDPHAEWYKKEYDNLFRRLSEMEAAI